MTDNSYHRGLHYLAVITACMIVPLIFVGAGVTSKEAGMAFSTWPDSDGHFLNPPQWWTFDDRLWEHGHRLIGWIVGVLALGVAAIGLFGRHRAAIRAMAVASLLAIAVQGVLGGLRVWQVSTLLAMMHGVFGQACFCLVAVLAVTTSRSWAMSREPVEAPATVFLRRLSLVCTGAIFCQLVIGAAVRHFARMDALVPHVFLGISLAMLIGWLAMWVMAQHASRPLLCRPAKVMIALIFVQLLLGASAYFVTMGGAKITPFFDWAIPTVHVLVGAILLVSSLILTLACYRQLLPSRAVASPGSSMAVKS
ncbi:MAG: COX15/CtaA family protein [Planctomycetes bacterium]|nr:COX15/CtaA family protein [Planctomycetota bacterium]